MTDIEAEIAALQAIGIDALSARHVELFGKPPRFRNRVMLWRVLAWEIQRRHYGGLSAKATARLEKLISEIRLPTEPSPKVARVCVHKPREARGPTVGSTIVRTWHGKELRVAVVEGGFEYRGVVYKSLSAVARAITGTGWSGPLFFGLRGPKAAP